ncbi:MAG: hypothetical protein AAF465_13610 [Pseudomonadota bacterium]
MLLTRHVDDFRRSPKVGFGKSLGFREQCNYLLENGFRLHCSPFHGEYETSPVTRGFGRTSEASIPIDSKEALVAEDYVMALSKCETMLILYYHKGKRDKYCEISHSPDTVFVKRMFDYYRVCLANSVYEHHVDMDGTAS